MDNNTVIWYTCPNCKTKLFKLLPGATANNIMVYCKKCKQEITVNINLFED